MKRIITVVTISTLSSIFLTTCRNKISNEDSKKQNEKVSKEANITKQGSTNRDTLTIFTPAAVFYYPDAVQKLNIRQTTDEKQYEAIMHEFEYLTMFSKKVISKNWPKVPITDVSTARYLRFVLKDHSLFIIDLDKIQEPIGLILCNGKNNPTWVDMANIESMAGLYLN